MLPITFKESNRKLYAPSEEGCCSKIPLPVWTDGTQCVSCWKCSFLERLKILFTGRVWVSVRSGETQPPMWVEGAYPFIENEEEQDADQTRE